MKTGKYISPSGETLEVIQVDEENKRVEVDYGTHCHWWGETEYSTWELVNEEENLIAEPETDTGEKVLDYQQPEEPPIIPEAVEKPKRKRKTNKK